MGGVKVSDVCIYKSINKQFWRLCGNGGERWTTQCVDLARMIIQAELVCFIALFNVMYIFFFFFFYLFVFPFFLVRGERGGGVGRGVGVERLHEKMPYQLCRFKKSSP